MKYIITSLRSLLLKSVAVFTNFYMVIYKFPTTMAILIVGSYLRSLGLWSSMWTGSASLQIIIIEKVWISMTGGLLSYFLLLTEMIHRKRKRDLIRGKKLQRSKKKAKEDWRALQYSFSFCSSRRAFRIPEELLQFRLLYIIWIIIVVLFIILLLLPEYMADGIFLHV